VIGGADRALCERSDRGEGERGEVVGGDGCWGKCWNLIRRIGGLT
jgi:hypothetical protein